MKNEMRPVHPGEILHEDFLKPLGMSLEALAEHLKLSTYLVTGVVQGVMSVTPNIAMRLARLFGGDALSWLNLQDAYDRKLVEIEVTPLASLPQ